MPSIPTKPNKGKKIAGLKACSESAHFIKTPVIPVTPVTDRYDGRERLEYKNDGNDSNDSKISIYGKTGKIGITFQYIFIAGL